MKKYSSLNTLNTPQEDLQNTSVLSNLSGILDTQLSRKNSSAKPRKQTTNRSRKTPKYPQETPGSILEEIQEFDALEHFQEPQNLTQKDPQNTEKQ